MYTCYSYTPARSRTNGQRIEIRGSACSSNIGNPWNALHLRQLYSIVRISFRWHSRSHCVELGKGLTCKACCSLESQHISSSSVSLDIREYLYSLQAEYVGHPSLHATPNAVFLIGGQLGFHRLHPDIKHTDDWVYKNAVTVTSTQEDADTLSYSSQGRCSKPWWGVKDRPWHRLVSSPSRTDSSETQAKWCYASSW